MNNKYNPSAKIFLLVGIIAFKLELFFLRKSRLKNFASDPCACVTDPADNSVIFEISVSPEVFISISMFFLEAIFVLTILGLSENMLSSI